MTSSTLQKRLDAIKMAQVNGPGDEPGGGDDSESKAYEANLLLESGESIPLGSLKDSVQITKTINQFLDGYQ